jgi:hypothetical protein
MKRRQGDELNIKIRCHIPQQQITFVISATYVCPLHDAGLLVSTWWQPIIPVRVFFKLAAIADDSCALFINILIADWYLLLKSTVFWDISKPSKKTAPSRWQTQLCLPPAWCSFLAWLILRPWKWRRHVPQKRQLTFNGLHGVISQKIEFFTTHRYENSNFMSKTNVKQNIFWEFRFPRWWCGYLLGCDTLQHCRWFSTFRRSFSSIVRVEMSKLSPALNFYSGSARFKSRPELQLFSGFSWVSLVPQDKYSGNKTFQIKIKVDFNGWAIVYTTRDYWIFLLLLLSGILKNTTFRKRDLFPKRFFLEYRTMVEVQKPSNPKWYTPYTKVQWLRLALSNGTNRVGVYHPLTWGRKQIQFPKRRVY